MKARAVEVLLWLYDQIATRGILNRPIPRRAFESTYVAYKTLIEAGPVGGLRAAVPPGSAVVDVGANIGFFTLMFGRWVGPAGRVIAIEPEHRNLATLRRRVARAGLDQIVECVQAVAADRAGELRLAVNPAHPGDHRIAEQGEPVSALAIDDLTAGEGRPVALVKIDVQGAELLVLRGAWRTIQQHRPALFVELDDCALKKFGSSSRELIESLARRGYSGHALTRRGIGPPQLPTALAAQSAEGYIDVLFLPVEGRPAARR